MADNINPVIVTASELEVHFGEHIILDKASLSIHEGDRIGLIGRNGSGKSTFLKIIAGALEPDDGNVARRRDLRTGYLPQEFLLDENRTVYENILEGASEIKLLLHEYETLPHDSSKRHLLEEKIIAADGWNLDNRIGIIMHSLNAPQADRLTGTLSGGEKRRVAMCKALIAHPDFLILDEPTNHLDTESIEWTEDFLASYSGTCLFVTHDRYFLDRIANRIVELSNGTFYSHNGNYTDYLINKAEREYNQEQEEGKRQSFLRRELEWVRKGPRARRTKAKSRLDHYFEVASQRPPEKELDVEMIIPPAAKPGTKILNLKNLSAQMGGRELFQGLNFIFEKGRKLGIVGRNGLGKTTLLRVILGQLAPEAGKVELGERTFFNYVDQTRLLLNESNTVLQEIGEGRDFIEFGDEKLTVWKYLRRFLFTDDRINTKIERLSGGEKSRLLLARILKNGGNFLILDEPTNDLDLPTLRILEEALSAFNGCVIVVSHDRYFLNRVCNGILAFEGEGNVYFSEGDYDYYLEKRKLRLKEIEQKNPAPMQKEKAAEKPKPASRKLKWKEARELETIEQDIIAAEDEVARIEAIFSSADFYEKYARQTNELTAELEKAKERVKMLFERWEELEKIKNGEVTE
ncbi:MAG: ABC-F family ATP-binding cassette domain-containing protein [Ignavibacteria bacterium]|jgi:ATP-binding cassette subfamily F protein uup|nr:ABC-F family ATP-binding cassette domain-containing protein [Ignavibacteria bacterium]MCU7504484.1 ABC-F family ATP-binding cassette domain-containing protein [Ignavibacteria bacterium]MCU7517937.1 ABC-F family ATP-binding cassette domain-containing protein [Ignavibacteria bacterium]